MTKKPIKHVETHLECLHRGKRWRAICIHSRNIPTGLPNGTDNHKIVGKAEILNEIIVPVPALPVTHHRGLGTVRIKDR